MSQDLSLFKVVEKAFNIHSCQEILFSKENLLTLLGGEGQLEPEVTAGVCAAVNSDWVVLTTGSTIHRMFF